MPLTYLGKFEGLGASAATGAPGDCYEEGAESTGHAFETGLEIRETLVVVESVSKLHDESDLVHERSTIWVLGGKNSSEK